MWMFLSIVAFLTLLITAILLLPISIILKNDENGKVYFRFKVLFKTFGEKSNPNNPISKTLKEISGVSRLEKKNLESDMKRSGLSETVEQTCRILMDLLKEIVKLLKYCTAKRFVLKIVCAEDTAADTAVSYGRCCSVIYPLASFLSTIMKVRKKGQHIDISCNYVSGEGDFKYDLMISVKLCHILAAFFRIILKEAKRAASEPTAEKKPQKS